MKLVETCAGRKMKYLQTDNCRQYCSANFDRYLEENGILRRPTATHIPRRISVAERQNRILSKIARCLLLKANFLQSFWAEAVNITNFNHNWSQTRSSKDGTEYEK